MRSFVLSLLSISFAPVAWADDLEPTGFITYSGLNLAVYESAGTEGPGVLLVHGNTASAQSYARVLDSDFAEENRLAALDLPGFGRSDNAPSYDADVIAAAVKLRRRHHCCYKRYSRIAVAPRSATLLSTALATNSSVVGLKLLRSSPKRHPRRGHEENTTHASERPGRCLINHAGTSRSVPFAEQAQARAQPFDLVEQLQRQGCAGKVYSEIALQPQGGAGTP